jgi:hypothetical protein
MEKGGGCGENRGVVDFQSSPSTTYPGPVDDEEEEWEDDEDEEEEVVGRLLRRCWLRGMPRCTDR